jgi:hypothetical protein
LVWGREFSVDATHVLANASLDSLVPRFAVEARAALHTHQDALFPGESTLVQAPQATPDREQAGESVFAIASLAHAAASCPQSRRA